MLNIHMFNIDSDGGNGGNYIITTIIKKIYNSYSNCQTVKSKNIGLKFMQTNHKHFSIVVNEDMYR